MAISRISSNIEQHYFFRNVQITSAYVLIYSIVYFYLGAKLGGAYLLTCGLLFTPFVYFFEVRGFSRAARFLYCVSTLFYVFSAWVGLQVDIDIEFYFIVSFLLPTLVFNQKDKALIWFTSALSPLAWAAETFISRPVFSAMLYPQDLPAQWFKGLNFFGSGLILYIFLKYLVQKDQKILSESEKNNTRQEYLLEGAALGAWDWWIDSNKVIFDRRWCEMLGLNFREVKQEISSWELLIHPDDRINVRAQLDRCLTGATPNFEAAYRMRHANGSWIWILDRGRVSEFGIDGKPIRFTGTHFDLTKYKESEFLLNEIQELSKTGGWELDLSTEKLTWTDEVYHIHKVPIGSQLTKIEAISFYAEKDRNRISQCVEQCIRGIPFHQTFEFHDALGTVLCVEALGVPVLGASGKITKIRGMFRDVTEFKTAEKKLESTAHELNKYFTMSLDLLCISDPDGRYTKVNPAFNKVLGYPLEDLISRPFFDYVHPDDIPKTQMELQRLNEGEQTIDFKNRYKCLDGTYRTFLWTASPDPISGLIYAAARDITDLVKAEEQAKLERTKALHTAKLASLGEMAAGIAHEINNPLTVIVAFSDLLLRKISGDSEQAKRINSIQKSAERITKIVRGLRRFSRSGTQLERKVRFMPKILGEVMALMEVKAQKYGVNLYLDAAVESNILCDELEIEQVLINLVGNGIDAAREVDDKWVRVALNADNKKVFLRVTDSGKGISAENSKRIFDPFFTTKVVGEGTGLGLSISKSILDEHKATIELLENEPNTCFEIVFDKALAETPLDSSNT